MQLGLEMLGAGLLRIAAPGWACLASEGDVVALRVAFADVQMQSAVALGRQLLCAVWAHDFVHAAWRLAFLFVGL